MSTKVSALKRAANAFEKAMGPQRYGIRGKTFACRLCGHDRFMVGEDLPLTSIHSLACAECGHIELFAKLPPIVDDNAV
jgi:hypothetical protein